MKKKRDEKCWFIAKNKLNEIEWIKISFASNLILQFLIIEKIQRKNHKKIKNSNHNEEIHLICVENFFQVNKILNKGANRHGWAK